MREGPPLFSEGGFWPRVSPLRGARSRLERRDLPPLCGPVSNMDTIPPECVDCIRDCNWCTYNIADPGNYHRR